MDDQGAEHVGLYRRHLPIKSSPRRDDRSTNSTERLQTKQDASQVFDLPWGHALPPDEEMARADLCGGQDHKLRVRTHETRRVIGTRDDGHPTFGPTMLVDSFSRKNAIFKLLTRPLSKNLHHFPFQTQRPRHRGGSGTRV